MTGQTAKALSFGNPALSAKPQPKVSRAVPKNDIAMASN